MIIVWSSPAVADLENLRDYIAHDSPYYAAIFIEKIIAAVEKIISFPLMGRIVPEYGNKNIREVIYQNYRIIYKINAKTIFILTIVHGGRNLYRLFKK